MRFLNESRSQILCGIGITIVVFSFILFFLFLKKEILYGIPIGGIIVIFSAMLDSTQ